MAYCQKNGIETIDKDIFRAKFDKVIALYNARQEGGIDGYRSKILGNLTDHTLCKPCTRGGNRKPLPGPKQNASLRSPCRKRQNASAGLPKKHNARKKSAARQKQNAKHTNVPAQKQKPSAHARASSDTLEVPVQAAFELSDEPDAEQPAPAPEPGSGTRPGTGDTSICP